VLVTSDHGVTPVPEQVESAGGRIQPDSFARRLTRAIERGSAPVVGWSFVEPFVTLGVEGRARREEVVPRVVALAQAEPGVHAAFDVRTAEALRASSDPLRRSVSLGIDGAPPGDVYIVPSAGWVIDPDMAVGQGNSHGGAGRQTARCQ
jgi:hypothetical protein